MKASELQKQIRIGNYLLGKCIDDLDDRKEWWEIYKIQDAEHLMGIMDDWDKPIELTEEILLKCGFEKAYESEFTITYNYIKDDRFFIKINISSGFSVLYCGTPIKVGYLHQLQNLYHCIVGIELEINL